MATFELIIRGDWADLAAISGALARAGVEPAKDEDHSPEPFAAIEPKPATRGRGKKADAPAPADVFSQEHKDAQAATNAQAHAVVEAAPVAGAGAGAAVTYDSLKDLMTELLKKKSASVAQQVIRDATGQSSLSACTVDQYPAAHAALVAALA